MTPAMQAAVFRFASVVVALGVATAIFIYVPDPNVKVAASGLVIAAIMALEEFVKTRAGV